MPARRECALPAGPGSFLPPRARALGLCLAAAGLLACTPTLDWRDVQPAGLGVAAQFPCKPTRETRPVTLADTPVSMTLLACTAGGATFGLAVVELADPRRRALVRDALRDAVAGNLGAPARMEGAASVPGADADPPPRRERVDGRRPDGQALGQQAVSFGRGLRIYQATVQGATLDAAATAPFFEGLRAVP